MKIKKVILPRLHLDYKTELCITQLLLSYTMATNYPKASVDHNNTGSFLTSVACPVWIFLMLSTQWQWYHPHAEPSLQSHQAVEPSIQPCLTAKRPDSLNCGVHLKALPNQRARPETSTKGRTQPMACLIVKPSLEPCPTLGHSLMSHLTMKPGI